MEKYMNEALSALERAEDITDRLAMFDNVGVPVIGVVENMSYFICDECGKHHHIFREGGGERIAQKWGVPLVPN